MKILHLHLCFKWYDMIEAGIKTEEYRRKCPYWDKRLTDDLTHVRFYRGYTKKSMLWEIKWIQSYAQGNPEWGAKPGEEYNVIHLGFRSDFVGLEIRNIWGHDYKKIDPIIPNQTHYESTTV